MRQGILVAALLAGASPAFAGSLVSTQNCRFSHYYGYSDCVSTLTYVPTPIPDPAQERIDAAAQQKEDAKWEAFCKPTFRSDEYGIRRASYAEKGCDVGRSE